MNRPKKIIDIIAPKNFKSKLKVAVSIKKEKTKRPAIKLPILKILVVFIVLLMFGGILSAHFVFAKAVITVWPKIKEVSLTQRIVVMTEIEEINEEARYIPGTALSIRKEATQLFDATGSQIQTTKAQGVIRIFNERSVVQVLIVNTRFVSEDGFVFRSSERIVIPADKASSPGFFDVHVTAAEAGSKYNIKPSSFSVPGLAGSTLYTKIYGKSEQNMMGGSIGSVTVVTGADIERAGKKLETTLTIQAKKDLQNQLTEGFVIPEDGFVVEVLESSSLIKPGAALLQFNYSSSVLVKAIAFKFTKLEELSHSMLASQIEKDESLNLSTFQVALKARNLDEKKGILDLDVTISADSYILVSVNEIEELIRGKTPFNAEVLIVGQKGIDQIQVSLWPFWLTKIPLSLNRVEIIINVD